MRVITGRFKGRQLRTVRDLSVRPATDRVKKTIFDMLTTRLDFNGIRVLDLFAGSGALAFEALSRGAAHATLVENDRNATAAIEANAEALGCQSDTLILQSDALAFVQTHREPFDLIFADPPYAYRNTAGIPAQIFGRGLLRSGGYLLIEHAPDIRFASTPQWHAGPEKKFGRTLVTFFRHSTPDHTPSAAEQP